MHARVPIGSLWLAGASIASVCAPVTLHAQVWQITNGGAQIQHQGFADVNFCNPPAFDFYNVFANGLIAGYGSASYGQSLYIGHAQDVCPNPNITSDAQAISNVRAFGDLTQRITLRWDSAAWVDFNGDDQADISSKAYIGTPGGAANPLDGFFVELNTSGAPAGFPLTVYYSWNMRSRGFNRQEVPGSPGPPHTGDDFAIVRDMRLDVGASEFLGGQFDFDINQPFIGVNWELRNQSGSFTVIAGQPLLVRFRSEIEAEVHPPPEPSAFVGAEDAAWVRINGELRLWLDVPPPPTPPPGLPGLPPAFLDFSLDIGSDTELSDDPIRGAERVFDPGDVYAWGGPPLPNPGGLDGYRDDANIWSVDPFPSPPDLFSGAPVCSGVVPPPSNYFDLDGHDSVNVDLTLFIPQFSPVASPIPMGPLPLTTPATCIWPAEYLLVSFEDDQQQPYPTCDVPATATSPVGHTYGAAPHPLSQGFDEVMGLVVSPFIPSAPFILYPLALEQTVHISMLPDPAPGNEEWDDDVDSLDATPIASGCPLPLFGADHEANYYFDPQHGDFSPLDPGGVYQVGGPGLPPRKIVDPMVHLGLPFGADLADFEFVSIHDSGDPLAPLCLALIFAVHEDDLTTFFDESAGLNPNMIYASFLNGFSQPFLLIGLPDDVDAITAFARDLSLPDPPPSSGWCPGDSNDDQLVNFADITVVLANWGQTYPPGTMGFGDANCNGFVNFQDITVVLANFGNTCP